MINSAGETPSELMILTNEERVKLIRGFPVRDVVSPPGHTVLRSREAMLSMSALFKQGKYQSLLSEPIILNVFPERVQDGLPDDLAVHCVDGTHRLVAGLHAGVWQRVGDLPSELLDVWIEGWAAGETSGPRPRWIPLNVAQESFISDWVDVSGHPKARGPSAQIPADIRNDSVRIPMSHRGVGIETVLTSTLGDAQRRDYNSTAGSMFRYRGAEALVALHEDEMRGFLESWRRAKAAGATLPAVDDPDYASFEALLRHVFRWARGYLRWVCEQLDLPDPNIGAVPDVAEIESEADGYLTELLGAWKDPLRDVERSRFLQPEYVTPWGSKLPIEAMLEHAVMHPIRHRYQLERLLNQARG
jgi:hypothetical protein